MTLSPEMMVVLAAVGGFIARQVWPWFRAQVDADFKAKREALKAGVAERETRYLAAMEQFVVASKQHAEAIEHIGQALETMSKALIVSDLSTQRLERRMDEMVRPVRPRVRPRKREETPA